MPRNEPTAPAEIPVVTGEELAAMAERGELAWVYAVPPPAPRTSAHARTTATQPDSRGLLDAALAGQPPPPGAVARLTFDDGRFVDVTGPGLVGRDPGRRQDSTHTHLVVLDDLTKELSRVHLEFGIAGDGSLWVADNYSTNGVEVTRPGAGAIRCVPGERFAVRAGDVVAFGGRVMSVTRPRRASVR